LVCEIPGLYISLQRYVMSPEYKQLRTFCFYTMNVQGGEEERGVCVCVCARARMCGIELCDMQLTA
jgi:hypothetical protein